MAIHLRSADEIEKMHRAGLIVHEVLNTLRSSVRPGMTTMDLEKIAEEKLASRLSRGIAGIHVCFALR